MCWGRVTRFLGFDLWHLAFPTPRLEALCLSARICFAASFSHETDGLQKARRPKTHSLCSGPTLMILCIFACACKARDCSCSFQSCQVMQTTTLTDVKGDIEGSNRPINRRGIPRDIFKVYGAIEKITKRKGTSDDYKSKLRKSDQTSETLPEPINRFLLLD